MEEQIAKDIQKALNEAGSGGFVEIPLAPFLHSWANGKASLSDNDVSKGLMQFAKTYSMDYVWILSGGINVHPMLRFWKKVDHLEEPEVTYLGDNPEEIKEN